MRYERPRTLTDELPRHWVARNGHTIDVYVWHELREDADYVSVGHDTMPDGAHVDTTWLGLPGRHYETVVTYGPLHGQRWRWSNDAEALIGHASVCHVVRMNPMPPPRDEPPWQSSWRLHPTTKPKRGKSNAGRKPNNQRKDT